MAMAIRAIEARTNGWTLRGTVSVAANQIRTAAADPHVPGPGPSVPMPKKVAVRNAQAGGLPGSTAGTSTTALSVFIVAMATRFCFELV
jgi:hypothetical protein